MASKKHAIDIREAERALLTDTLPYELPLFYNNANLAIIARQSRNKSCPHDFHERLLLQTPNISRPTKPYTFEIKKNSSSLRRLSLAHPKSQHLLSQFYGKYDQFVSNACSRSSYSLRYPSRVATHYVDPRYAIKNEAAHNGQIDEDPAGFRDQRRWASTYFSYRDYSLSHKFFESDAFLDLEKRFSLLMKLDVSKCFESIYTHSIEWSMRGKDFSKDHLPNPSSGKTTFESEFDSVVRNANWNETHGIIVGPESSRIFAEIILQSADRAILGLLGKDSRDSAIRRYVDDFYIFSNSQQELDRIKEIVRRSLLALNLHLNESKTEISPRPFISKISAARSRVATAITDFFKISEPLFEATGVLPEASKIDQARSSLISNLRKISVELDVSYEQFSSFALTVLNRQLGLALEKIQKSKPDVSQGHLVRLSWLTSSIRVAQFLFSMDDRVTTSVKLAAIYSSTIELATSLQCARAPLERQMLDGLRNANTGTADQRSDQVTKINHICAIDLILTEDRRIELQDIHQYIGNPSKSEVIESLSPFQLIAILFLCRKRHRFQEILASTKAEIERRVRANQSKLLEDTEAAILLTEYISCPYVDPISKRELIKSSHKAILGSTCDNKKADLIATNGAWVTFTDWGSTTDLASMLARKELTPAYE